MRIGSVRLEGQRHSCVCFVSSHLCGPSAFACVHGTHQRTSPLAPLVSSVVRLRRTRVAYERAPRASPRPESPTMPEPIIRTQNLTRAVAGRVLVHDVSLAVT